MVQFLKYVLATIIGIFLFTLISFFLMIGIGAMLSGGDDKTEVKSNSVLQLNLNTQFTENGVKEDPFSNIFGNNETKTSISELKSAIANAKLDPNIKGISMKLEYPSAGFAELEEIRNDLLDFKKSGKFIYSYAEIMTEKAVYLSSAATKSFINPAGGIEFNGLDAEVTFMKGLFDKIGVKPVIFRVGEFKSAIEPYIRTNMSPENKMQVSEYINSISNHIYGKMAESKGMTKAEIDEILNKALIQKPEDAVKYKILTDIGYEDEYDAALRKALGLKDDAKITSVSLSSYGKAKKLVKEGSRDNRIAVIVAEGEINSGKGQSETIGSETFVKELIKARKDKKIKAIVLRINSPGGSAMASDIMWREIELTKKVKPVIASMGNVAASGGYYMAMGCDSIVAQPTTITGSIGIFGMLINTQELMNNKLGITFDGVKTHEFADSPSITREMSDAEKMMIQNSVNLGYEKFTSKAAAGRRMKIEDLKAVAGGRVWTGEQAIKIGLVDKLGGIDEAIKVAANKAKLKAGDYQVKYYPFPKTEFEQIMEKFNKSGEDAKLKEYLGILAPFAKEVKSLQKMEKLQAKMPYDLEIK
ncbi:signal peptide peptidase SppA [Lacihabitans sp. LS3-19]|uniref:signal peptide peptidase SppA n=1 Tax=Lacihabitans sp. LS3-19 TaxID=2487335 RepID=UPI0020CCA52D|nr:signal peptide peptidase SppA [Lacihabitans sp. LS3-19]MCP9768683.1 signal peptide peptidase SppA [Lacihabitans sp. LS3-19]